MFPVRKERARETTGDASDRGSFLLQTLGNVVTYAWDKLTPSIAVQYATRRDAEKAMAEGRNLGDRLLTLTWASEVASGLGSPPPPAAAAASSGEAGPLQKKLLGQGGPPAPHSTSVVAQEDEVSAR